MRVLNENLQEEFVLCCECLNANPAKTAFVKGYKETAICLCENCALKLAAEINEKYAEQKGA